MPWNKNIGEDPGFRLQYDVLRDLQPVILPKTENDMRLRSQPGIVVRMISVYP